MQGRSATRTRTVTHNFCVETDTRQGWPWKHTHTHRQSMQDTSSQPIQQLQSIMWYHGGLPLLGRAFFECVQGPGMFTKAGSSNLRRGLLKGSSMMCAAFASCCGRSPSFQKSRLHVTHTTVMQATEPMLHCGTEHSHWYNMVTCATAGAPPPRILEQRSNTQHEQPKRDDYCHCTVEPPHALVALVDGSGYQYSGSHCSAGA